MLKLELKATGWTLRVTVHTTANAACETLFAAAAPPLPALDLEIVGKEIESPKRTPAQRRAIFDSEQANPTSRLQHA